MATFVRYEHDGRVHGGELRDGSVHRLEGPIGGFQPADDEPIPLGEVRLLAPTAPGKIVAIGPNYRAHFASGAIGAARAAVPVARSRRAP